MPMTQHRTRKVQATLAMLTALATLAGLLVPPGAVALPYGELVYVRAGTTLYVTDSIEAAEVRVAGSIVRVAPGDLAISAHLIEVEDGGTIFGYDGPRGLGARGLNAIASDGEDGGDVVIVADRFNLREAGTVQSGSGGAGGYALGLSSAAAGDGGDSGDVHIAAAEYDMRGLLLVGRGGDGGLAAVAGYGEFDSGATVHAGDGGDAGSVRLNGVGVRFLMPVIEAPATSIGEAPQLLDCDGDCETLPTDCNVECSGLGGLPGLLSVGCQKPTGDPGRHNALGHGGDGGDACSETTADSGGVGKRGWNGLNHCGAGGAGGLGGNAESVATRGGDGGHGFRGGGDGGDSSSTAIAGSGGNGGAGGVTWNPFVPDCAGGPGGIGGSATSGAATAGSGGHGLCGSGGAAGTPTSTADGGAGGDGGSGAPAGPAGAAGNSGSGGTIAGQAGFGTEVCAPLSPQIYARQ